MSSSSSYALPYFLLSTSLLFTSLHFQSSSKAQAQIVSGLSWKFYESSCPKLESIVRKQLKKVFKKDIGQAAGLLRLHFHDCFVQGCDASVLLDGSASGPGEQSAPPNLSLRPEAFKIIEDLRRRVHKKCGRIVSCADIVALAARDSVFLSGGPDYDLPLGRRDGVSFATVAATLANLPPPSANATTILDSLSTKGFTAADTLALSGAHTIGVSHCTSFTGRLYPTQDPSMDQTLAARLRAACPSPTTDNTTVMDLRSPDDFDNKYFVGLMNRQGLFTSDQDLYTDRRTRAAVVGFAVNQSSFFEAFASAMVKMSQLGVLTGGLGEVRGNCSAINSGGSATVAEVVGEASAEVVSAV